MFKGLFIAFLPLIACLPALAQTDFSGAWTFKNQESVSGNLYGNGSPTQIKITQMKDAISIEKTSAKGDGTSITASDANIGFDGKPVEIQTASKRKKIMTGAWSADKKTFTETVNIYSQTDATKADHKQTDTYSLSDDGRTLSLDRKDENFVNGETWESVATYEKQ